MLDLLSRHEEGLSLALGRLQWRQSSTVVTEPYTIFGTQAWWPTLTVVLTVSCGANNAITCTVAKCCMHVIYIHMSI